MVKIIQILGTRPNVVKYVPMKDVFEEKIIYTGQHYSDSMNLLSEFKVQVDYNLFEQDLPRMTSRISEVLVKEKPSCVVVYGDTRSTLAGAIAAFENQIPIAHVEAGVRLQGHDRYEERVRRAVDALSQFLFCPTQEAQNNLVEEKTKGKSFFVGDVMLDRYYADRPNKGYVLATIHRQETVDKKPMLKGVLSILSGLGEVILPLHPRTKERMKEFGLTFPENIKTIDPVNHSEMSKLIREARLITTDSGGVAREAFFAGVPVTEIGPTEWNLHPFGMGDAGSLIKKHLKEELKK